MAPPADTSARDAARLAGGSGIVFAAGLVDRGTRLLVTWLLSGWLGSALYGVYAAAVTVVSLVSAFAPLGLDTGVVYFGARYKQAGDAGRRKGLVILGLILAVFSGSAVALAVGSAASWLPALWARLGLEPLDPALLEVLPTIAPVIALWTPLLFFVGSLRAVKDMRRSALALQLAVPGSLLLGITVALVGGWGLVGALMAFVVAHGVGLGVAIWGARRHYAALLRDRAVKAIIEPGRVLAYSIPQSLTAGVFRLNQWMDVLMLTALATMADVGHYRVAASLAVIGAMPVNAIASMFNPMISELVQSGERARLDALLKNVTRWLVILTVPFYLVLLGVPELILGLFADEYLLHSLGPLLILVLGQAVSVSCAPTMRLIPMSGHAMLNLANGVVAAALNIGLNLWLIPLHGSLGAAMATATTLAAWSLWRLGEVWLLLRCFPFSGRTLGLLGLAAAGAAGLRLFDLDLWARLPLTMGLLAAFAAAVWAFGRTPDDAVVVDKFKAKLRRLRR